MIPTELLKKIRRIEISARHMVENVLSGNYLSTFQGQGLEFSEVREYQEGDEVRQIDWNVTARMNRPFIKVYQEERELTVILAVDISSSTEFGTKGSSKREMAAQLAAALGFAAAVNGDRVGMVLFSDQVERVLPAKRGKRHVLRAVRDLLAHKRRGRGTSLQAGLARLKSMARRKATVFVISDFISKDLNADLRAAAIRYDLVAGRVLDPAEKELPAGLGLLPCRDPETGRLFWLDSDSKKARQDLDRLRAREEADMARQFKRLKVDFFEARTDQDFILPLVRFFRKREERRRH